MGILLVYYTVQQLILLLIFKIHLLNCRNNLLIKLHREDIQNIRYQYEGDIPAYLDEFEIAMAPFMENSVNIINNYLNDISGNRDEVWKKIYEYINRSN